LHLVGILFPHINDDAWSKSHQTFNKFVNASEIGGFHENGYEDNLHVRTAYGCIGKTYWLQELSCSPKTLSITFWTRQRHILTFYSAVTDS